MKLNLTDVVGSLVRTHEKGFGKLPAVATTIFSIALFGKDSFWEPFPFNI
jgi:hypothetical protein